MTSPRDEILLKELKLLYNHAEDDSRQFTRWNMVCAMNHGKFLQKEETEKEIRTYYASADARIDELTHNALPAAGVTLDVKSRARVQTQLIKDIRDLIQSQRVVPKEFVDGILHGDEEHRRWLKDEAIAFGWGNPLPEPRGANTKPGEYEEGYTLGFSQGEKDQRQRFKSRVRAIACESFGLGVIATGIVSFILTHL